MQARRARVTRGVLGAAVSTFAAAFSHGVVAGQAPSVLALAVASVLAVFVSTALAGRATPARLTIAVMLSQAGFHALFALAPAASGTATPVHGHHTLASASMDVLQADAVTHVHASAGPAMWLGHAVAAVVTIIALSRGERALLAIVDSLGLSIRSLLGAARAVPVTVEAPSAPNWLPIHPARSVVLASSLPTRGPPAAHRALASFA